MSISTRKVIKKFNIPIILFIVSTIFILPYLIKGGILTNGESSIPINPSYINYYSVWADKLNYGIFSPSQTNIFLYSIIRSILHPFSFIADPSVIFIFLSFFLSGLFLYICLDRILNLENKYVYLPACLLYSYNVFRTLGPLVERLNLLFIFLPLFFLFYYKLLQTQKWRYVFWLVFISIVSSSMAGNLLLWTIPYLLMFMYFIYFILFSGQFKKRWKTIILQNIVLALLIFIGNIFWSYPLAVYLLIQYRQLNEGNSLWSATSAGNYLNHFRLIGSWAWKAKFHEYPYYSFANNYSKPFLLFTTFSISIFSFFYVFSLRNNVQKKIKIFVFFSVLISFLLMSGDKGSLGFIYYFLYHNIPLFKMYREPFAKFTPLFIFLISFGLVFSITYFIEIFKIKKQWIIITILSFIILINAYPFFTTEAIPIKKWNGSKADNLVKIPSYWKNAKDYIDKNKMDQKLMIFPYSDYGNSYFWENGINVDGNVAMYYLDKNIVDAWSADKSNAGLIMQEIFKEENYNVNIAKLLGLFNIEHILQENDKDWRPYGAWTPSKSNNYLKKQGISQESGFGEFTIKNLKSILNYEMEDAAKTKQIINDELVGKQALIMYKVDNNNFLPHFYVPRNSIVSSGTIKDLLGIVINDQWQTRSAVFFDGQNVEKADKLKSVSSNKVESEKLPILEFKKINSTKYRIIVHGAENSFPVVFSESFHNDWKAYLVNSQIVSNDNKNKQIDRVNSSYKIIEGNHEDQADKKELIDYISQGLISNLAKKGQVNFVSKNFQGTIQNDNLNNGSIAETWFKTPLEEKTHLEVNGYANSWIIDTQSICKDSSRCIKNPDGSYDMEIVIEFWPQRLFSLSLVISGITFLGCILYLICYWRKKVNKERKKFFIKLFAWQSLKQ